MADSKCVCVILAGGSGTRFWPLSRGDHPKQYLKLFDDRSLLQHTFDRVSKLSAPRDIFTCSSRSQKDILRQQLPDCGGWILEPSARNTGPAVLLSALDLLFRGYAENHVMAVFPADHYISNVPAFEKAMAQAISAAHKTQGLVTLGIVPLSAHTGYGYIEAGPPTASGAFAVNRFIEKPNAHRAEDFVQTGKFFWNSGIFVWTLGSIARAFREFAARDFELLSAAQQNGSLVKAYETVTAAPVDRMVLEKARNVYVVHAEMGWSDVGSWSTLFDLKSKDGQNNVVETAHSTLIGSNGCLVHAPGKTVAVIGAKNLVVVVDGDAVLVCDRALDQQVREAATHLELP